jgi:hypothetical protein
MVAYTQWQLVGSEARQATFEMVLGGEAKTLRDLFLF